MRQKRGQPEIKRRARSRANAKATAGRNSIANTTTSRGVIFDIANILSGRPDTARISAVTPALGRKPPLRNSEIYCAGRTTAISISARLDFASRSAREGNNSLPLLFAVIQTDAKK